jgi:hypothetical protein
MEALIEHKDTSTLLASLVALLAIHLIWKIIELAFDAYREKSKETDKGIEALESKFERKLDQFSTLLSSYMETSIRLSDKMTATEIRLKELIEVEGKIRKLTLVVKSIAGGDWEKLKQEIIEDEFL